MVGFPSQSGLFSLLLPFAIICSLGVSELKANSCNEKDKQILLCFKHSLTDQSGMLSSWSTKEDCCEWRGVQCDINGRVTNLTLPCSTDDDEYVDINGSNGNTNHCLAGEIHPSLLELEFLNHLDLSYNNFKVINWSLGCHNLSLVNAPHVSENSSNLVYLGLSGNDMLAIDDLRWLLCLSSLEYIYLDFIDLHKETQWLHILAMLPSLSRLSLSSCKLVSSSPPLNYGNFTLLEYLDLSGNDFLSELPNWLFNLSGLSYLSLGENRFQGQIPNTILNLRNLHYLSLVDNRLSGKIPDWLGQLRSLHYLDLSLNLLTGSIPATLGNLSSLRNFGVSSNHLTGSLPQSFGKLSNLEYLNVDQTSLSGVVSHRNFANLSKLKELWLGSPFFLFDFGPHWTPPFQLHSLNLAYVDLKLLPWLYTQRFLDTLHIKSSSFMLESQEKFWSWGADIQFLSLFNNSMPWDMSNVLLNSQVIWLVANGLSGGLPRLTPNVRILNMGRNNLSGSLSPLLCHKMNRQNNLQYLDIHENFLSEEIPNCWENWKSLVNIELGGNNLTGTIPHSIGTLSNLLSLQLYDNNLHGQIPLSLKKCEKLLILNLAENKFSRSIPNWIGQNMRALQLRSNEFSGNVPLQMCQLFSLNVVDLANNRLTGAVPNCLHKITAMVFNNSTTPYGEISFEVRDVGTKFRFGIKLVSKGNELKYGRYMHLVDLSSNQLSGKIPSKLFRLTALQSLNLSHNQLIGTIPNEIGDMKQLESLDFSNNKLSGEIPQSMAALSFLGALNLSFNNLRGQIPLGTQLQGFTALSYIGNPELCGAPLMKNCTHDEPPHDTKLVGNDGNGSDEFLESLYMGIGVGFAISFWVVCGTIFFNRTWRHAYFKFLYDVKDQIYVKLVLKCPPSVQI